MIYASKLAGKWRDDAKPVQVWSGKMTDVVGILEKHDAGSFTVRTSAGQLVVIPRARALAGKVIPPPRPRRRHPGPKPS